MNHLALLMKSRLPPAALTTLRAVADAAERAGAAPYLVGGAIRDLLLGRETADLDVSLLNADAKIFDAIASLTGGVIAKRSQFNTARLALGGLAIDLAMARAEEYPSPGALPVVRPADSMRQDLARRDFSINAMAASLSADSWGALLDPHKGGDDLSAGVIRALHPASFRDDPTRIFRAARYAARLGMTLAPDTLRWALDSTRFIHHLSPERVRNEIELIFREPDAAGAALGLLDEWRALAAIHPSLKFHRNGWDGFADETGDLSRRQRAGVGYALLSVGASDSDANAIAARLRPNSAFRRAIRDAASLGRMAASGAINDKSNSELAALLDPLRESAIRAAALVAYDDTRRRLTTYLTHHRHLKPHLTGDDLIGVGIPRGPEIGRALAMLRAARMDGDATTLADECAVVENLMQSTQKT